MGSLTPALAATHEALYPRLDALARQAEAIAARKPDAEVPAATRAAAEALLFDAGRLVGRRGLAPAPDTFAALGTVLGQARAALDAFEARHSEWSSKYNGFVWRLPRGELRPVQRLRPHTVVLPDPRRDSRTAALREKIRARITERYRDGFADGLKAAAGSSSAQIPGNGEL